MAKTYPHWRKTKHKYKGNAPPCNYCDSAATTREEIAVDYMRGHDEEIRVCDEHGALLRANQWEKLA